MILPTDIPTRAQMDGLLAAREPGSISIYVPTSPSSRGDAERIELENLAAEAVGQLQQSGPLETTSPRSTRRSPTCSTTTSSGAIRREDIRGDGPVAAILRHEL